MVIIEGGGGEGGYYVNDDGCLDEGFLSVVICGFVVWLGPMV